MNGMSLVFGGRFPKGMKDAWTNRASAVTSGGKRIEGRALPDEGVIDSMPRFRALSAV